MIGLFGLQRFLPGSYRDAAARTAALDAAAARPLAPAIAALLRRQNPADSEARRRQLAALDRPRAAAVVTGQQVGLFAGPLYTLYKAATAVVVARELAAESGRPVVPLFWLQTEDHDFAEIARCRLAPGGRAIALAETPDDRGRSVGDRRLGPSVGPALAQLDEALQAQPHRTAVAELLRSAYRPEVSPGDAFGAVLRALFADEGLLTFDPRCPEAAEALVELHREALLAARPLARELKARADELERAELAVQVTVREDAPLAFYHPRGRKGPRHRLLAVEGRDDRFRLAGSDRIVEREQVLDRLRGDPLSLSTSALLRPLAQDLLLPTAVYVGGPAELAYSAQLQPLYRRFGRTQPLVVRRASFRLIEPAVRRALDALQLSPEQLSRSPRALLAEINARGPTRPTPAALRAQLSSALREALDACGEPLAQLDADVARALDKTRHTVDFAAQRFAQRYERALARSDATTTDRLRRAREALYPDELPQERVLGFASFAARYGSRELLRHLLARISPGIGEPVDIELAALDRSEHPTAHGAAPCAADDRRGDER